MIYFFILISFNIKIWGLGIGDWGSGVGGWGLGPITQSPSPNPHTPCPHHKFFIIYTTLIIYIKFYFKKDIKIWGLGIGDWGLGIGDLAQNPIPQTPNPTPPFFKILNYIIYIFNLNEFYLLNFIDK